MPPNECRARPGRLPGRVSADVGLLAAALLALASACGDTTGRGNDAAPSPGAVGDAGAADASSDAAAADDGAEGELRVSQVRGPYDPVGMLQGQLATSGLPRFHTEVMDDGTC